MPILNDKEYKCDFCHNIFNFLRDEIWSQEGADKEYKKIFPESLMNNREIVCDDCWKIIMRFN